MLAMGVGSMGNQDEVRKKIFLSKDDPAAALAALRLLISHADERARRANSTGRCDPAKASR